MKPVSRYALRRSRAFSVSFAAAALRRYATEGDDGKPMPAAAPTPPSQTASSAANETPGGTEGSEVGFRPLDPATETGNHAQKLVEEAFENPPMPSYLTTDGVDDVIPDYLASEEVRDTFRRSVEARTVGNAQLRKFIKFMSPSDYQMALDAAQGCRDAGLRIDAESSEMILSLLLRAGQLKHGLELYRAMLKSHICPRTETYNHLMEACLERGSVFAAQALFDDMITRGRHPDFQSYEWLMRSFALETPPQWQKAVAIFDKLKKVRGKPLKCSTYNALMTVYLNMEEFDYRVVYNAYYEMRYTKPKIVFNWDSYKLVAEALRRGRAPMTTRLLTFVDAWIQIVRPGSVEFWLVAIGFCLFLLLLRLIIVRIMVGVHDLAAPRRDSEDSLPI